jgi:YVTN family beta-propeller protein
MVRTAPRVPLDRGRSCPWTGLPRGGLLALLLALVTLVAPARGEELVTLFVTSEKTDAVSVYQGSVPDLTLVRSIKVGREPHNLGISPDGRWVATSNRRSGEVSVIDTATLAEVVRLPLGRQPHDLAFTSDSRTLFVCHEVETFVSVVEVGTWKVKPRLTVGRAQHDLSLSPGDRQLWFTVTNRPYKPGDPRVGVVDLATGQVTLIDTGANAHDVTLSPDGRVAWVTNSGFTHIPDARVHAVDVATREVLGSITVGKYPFHSPKRGRDGNAVPPTAPEMWFSDHGLRSVVAVSLAERQVVATVPVGAEPYHVAQTAKGTLFVANATSNTVTIIDGPRRALLGTLKVPPRPHGLAVLAGP